MILLLALILSALSSAGENEDARPWRNHVLGWFGKDPSEPSKEKMLAAVQKEIEVSRRYTGRHNEATREEVCLRLPASPREMLGQEGIAFRDVPGQSVRTVPKNMGGRATELQTRLDSLSKIGFFNKSEGSFQVNSAQMLPAFRYALTQKGYVNFLPGTDCLNVGKRVFDGIETITRTDDQVEGLRVYEVSYRLRVERAAWGNDPEIVQAFPELMNMQEDRFAIIKVLQGDDGWISMSEKKLELQKKLAMLDLENGERRNEYQARMLKLEAGDLPAVPSNEKLLNLLLYPENASSRSGDYLKEACLPLPFSLSSGDGDQGFKNVQDGKPATIFFGNAKSRSNHEKDALKNTLNVLEALQQAGLATMDIAANGASVRYTFEPDTIRLLGLNGSRRTCMPLGTIKLALLSVVPQGLSEQKVTLWAKVETPSMAAKQLARTLPAVKAVLDEGYPIFASIRLSEEKDVQPFWKFSGIASPNFPEIKYTEFTVSVRQIFLSGVHDARSVDDKRQFLDPYPYPIPSSAAPLPTLAEKEAGLQEAVAKKLIRHATEADFASWTQVRAAVTPKINPQVLADETRLIKYALQARKAYVVLASFRYPAGLYGAHSATFFISCGIPVPMGERGHSNVYDFNLTVCKKER